VRGQVEVQNQTYEFEDAYPAMGFRRFTVLTPLATRDDKLAIDIMRAMLAVNAPKITVSADGKRVEGSGFDLEFEFRTTAGDVFRLHR
jgi:hypothetical protein